MFLNARSKKRKLPRDTSLIATYIAKVAMKPKLGFGWSHAGIWSRCNLARNGLAINLETIGRTCASLLQLLTPTTFASFGLSGPVFLNRPKFLLLSGRLRCSCSATDHTPPLSQHPPSHPPRNGLVKCPLTFRKNMIRFNPLLRTGHYSVRMTKISILK